MRTLTMVGLLLVVAAVTAHAQMPGTLRVDLRDRDGQPLSGATLRIIENGRTAVGDSAHGRVVMAGLDAGTYEGQIVHAGRVLDVMRFSIAPLRVTDVGAVYVGSSNDGRCAYYGMFREPWSMSRISGEGGRIQSGGFARFEVVMGCQSSPQ